MLRAPLFPRHMDSIPAPLPALLSISWFAIPLPHENVRTLAPQEQKWYLTSLDHQGDSGPPGLVLSPRIYRLSFLRPGQEPWVQKQASVRKDTASSAFLWKSTAISTKKKSLLCREQAPVSWCTPFQSAQTWVRVEAEKAPSPTPPLPPSVRTWRNLHLRREPSFSLR